MAVQLNMQSLPFECGPGARNVAMYTNCKALAGGADRQTGDAVKSVGPAVKMHLHCQGGQAQSLTKCVKQSSRCGGYNKVFHLQ